MSKPVATASEVKSVPSPSTADNPGNVGAWSPSPAGPLNVVTTSKIKVAGRPAALSASQSFAFDGVNGSGSAVKYDTSVSLAASQTKLRAAGQFLLVDGDSANDAAAPVPSKLTVSSGLKLRTA